VLNIFGAEESANVNIVLSLVDFATQVLLVILGLVLVFSPDLLISQVEFGTAPTVENFLIAIPVGMVAYTGIETISNLAEEAKDYEKTVPAAAKLVVAAVFAIYLFLPAIALSAMPVNAAGETELGTVFAGDPVLGIVENMGLGSLENAVTIYVGILAATILFIATNAGIIGVSRLTYSMGQYRQVPSALRSLHPRFKTPYVAIIVFGTIACLVMVPGQADFLAKLYAFGALLSFTIAHVSVIKMRLDLPIRHRPWLGPFNVQYRDRSWPLFAFIGGTGTFIAWVVVTALNPSTLIFGFFWMVGGVLFYVLYRRNQGLPLTTTTKIVAPKTIVDHDVEYDSILVVFEDGVYSQEAIRTAVKMATRRRRGIHVLVTINVPANAPIDAVLPTAESKASTVIERSRVHGGRRVTGRWVKVRSGEAGSRIVQEAEDINARAIVFPLKPDLSGSLFSPAVQKVLAARPCRVILTSEPVQTGVVVR
jgi:APA family basic amino acid/polyamine antiporter